MILLYLQILLICLLYTGLLHSRMYTDTSSAVLCMWCQFMVIHFSGHLLILRQKMEHHCI